MEKFIDFADNIHDFPRVNSEVETDAALGKDDVKMTSIAMIFRMFVRDSQKKSALISQQSSCIEQVADKVTQMYEDTSQWTGQDIQRYLRSFQDLDMSDIELQILFERRSSQKNEKFPAQVSLPGGKPEEGETLLQTSIRETFEETSLDLADSQKYALIGEFPSILPFMNIGGVGNVYIKGYVFLQVSFDILPIHCCEGEIDGCIWTSLDLFREDPDIAFSYFHFNFLPGMKSEFNSVLPSQVLYDSEKYLLDDIYRDPSLLNHDFKLSGITLFFVHEFLKFGNYVTTEEELRRRRKFYYYTVDFVNAKWYQKLPFTPKLYYHPKYQNSGTIYRTLHPRIRKIKRKFNSLTGKQKALAFGSQIAFWLSSYWIYKTFAERRSISSYDLDTNKYDNRQAKI
ncbi:unnamed protein product [Moneuplotes crassus]|uniref:Nudix hydrolase domain-containing protein n=1 Tax=Euplotes crassus TaxID=5936 RepID=A0AAD1XGX7_EUPCR|nr:unnamed protein product [Moneuplotes crassus]